MGAGIMQLLFFGQQDVYLKSNPSMTFFKKVYKTHTNFAMESIKIEFNRSDSFIYEKTILKTKIPRHADLLSQMYLSIELPDIVSDSIMSFRWIKNIGEAILDNYSVSIGGSIIAKHYGEYLHLTNNIANNGDKREAFNKMTGNVIQIHNPEEYALIANNQFRPQLRYRIGSTYPVTIPFDPRYPDAFKPSIAARTIYIPLTFWFNKDVGNALPLISLQYSEVEITVELRPWAQLYKLLYLKNGLMDFYAPNYYIESHHLKNFVTNLRKRYLMSDTVLDCKCHIEANYIYLDDLERQYFAYKPLDYLIEQVTRIEYPNLKTIATVEMSLQNPIKEIMWVFKRTDLNLSNDWFNYQDEFIPILKTAKMLFNGIDRIDEKEGEYYNYLQPYQHHSGNPKDGMYMYSFSIFPEDFQPSGSVNASRINNIQFYLTLKSPNDTTYSYDVVFYIINYNFLRISSGLAGVVYNS